MNLCLPLSRCLILAAISLPALAATEFEDDVPLELVKIFLGNPGLGEPVLYTDIPDEFPAFTIPAGFELVGSIDQLYSLRVILQSAQSQEMARDSILNAFTRDGWQEIETFYPGMGDQQTGFVTTTPPLLLLQLCHDDLGTLSGNVTARDSGSLVNLNRSNNDPGAFTRQTCEEMNSQPRGFFRGGGQELAGYMPRLELPEPPVISPSIRNISNSGGGSSNHWDVSSAVDTDLSIDDLYQHFADQVADQGWAPDIETSGELMATGGWTKTVEDDVELIGLLTIYETADSHFDMLFRLVRRNSNSSSGVIVR